MDQVEKGKGTWFCNVKKYKNNQGIGRKDAGKLTDKMINEITKFYGLAIRWYADSIEDMKKGTWATFYNKSSSDENPQH